MSKHTPLAPRAVVHKLAVWEACSYVPTPPQEIIHAAGPHDGANLGARQRWVSAGVRTGKTTAASMELVAAMLAPTPRTTEWWVAAPTHSLADRCWKAVANAFTQHLPEHVIRMAEHDGELTIRNLAGHEALCLRRSTERPISLVGAGVDGMVVDEASGISDEAWSSGLSTRLLDRMGWVLGISSPRGARGWWYQALCRGLKGDDPSTFGVILPTHSNPRVSRAELRRLRASMEEWRWRQEYLGEPVAADGKVLSPEALTACSTARFREPIPGENYLAGLDIGGGNGGDRTVLVIARAGDDGLCDVVKVHAWSKLPFEAMGYRVRAVLRRYNDAPVRVDETGIGAPVLQQLVGLGIPASGVVFTAASKNAMVRNLAVMLERGRIVLPSPAVCPLLDAELRDFEYLDSDSGSLGGHRKMGSPNGHDDHVAGLLLASSWFHGGGGSCRIFAKGRDLTPVDDHDDEQSDDVEDRDDDPIVRGSARVRPGDSNRRVEPPSRYNLGLRLGNLNIGRRPRW